MNDTVIIFGDEIKALGDGKIAGRLVTFGDPKHTDITRNKDFFTKQTDFDADFSGEVKSTVYYNHGLDKTIGKQKLGDGVKATLTMDDVGIWAEAQLNMANKYEAIIYKMVSEKKMAWSSGTVSHLVEREEVGDAHWIKKWGIGLDASLTPIPADYRNKAIAVKSLDEWEAESEEDSFVTGEGLSISKHIKSVLLQVEILTDRINTPEMKMGAMINKQNKSMLKGMSDSLKQHAETLDNMAEEKTESTAKELAENETKKSLEIAELKAAEQKELTDLELQNLAIQETEFNF